LDRRTDRPDGSGGGSPAVVTSRASDDNLIDDQDSGTSDIMAPPRQARSKQPGKPAPTASDDAASDGTAGGVSPNGTPAGGIGDAPANGAAPDKTRPAVDDTVVDGVPALPADTIGSSRAARSKGSDAEQARPGGKDQPPVDDSPAPSALSFAPPSAQPPPAEDSTIAHSPTPAVRPESDALVTPSVFAPGSAASPGDRPGQAQQPSVSPAAFAWEMPDPPAHSPSSPARAFLRSGASDRKSPPPVTGPLPGSSSKAAAGSQATSRGAAPKVTAVPPRRTARQAHLTVARVEPWSVMKFSFVVSLVAFVILFVAVSVLYGALAGLGVFDSLQRVVSDVTSSQGSAGVNAKAWFSASRVLGYTALLGSLNIVLITAMSTIGAVVYNLTSRLVGGVEVTLKETE
jgi:Transmembrane domain of unknown function (DUF3566)